MKRLVFNLLLLLVVILPLWILMRYALLWLVEGSEVTQEWIAGFAFQYVILSPQMLVGGLLQQLLLWWITHTIARSKARIVAMLSTVLIPLSLLAFAGGEPGLLLAPDVLGTLVVALVIYGITLKLPNQDGGREAVA